MSIVLKACMQIYVGLVGYADFMHTSSYGILYNINWIIESGSLESHKKLLYCQVCHSLKHSKLTVCHNYQSTSKDANRARGQEVHRLTMISIFALFKSPRVVCLEEADPRGTFSFSFSKQYRKCALLKQKINLTRILDITFLY